MPKYFILLDLCFGPKVYCTMGRDGVGNETKKFDLFHFCLVLSCDIVDSLVTRLE